MNENAVSDAVRKFGITVEDYMLPARHQIQMVDPDGRLKAESEQGAEPGPGQDAHGARPAETDHHHPGA